VSRKSIVVAAALVFHQGRLLITQRPPTGHLASLWEFPGGKLEPGETFEECLRRELREELAIEIEPGTFLSAISHSYPELTVHLRFFKCTWLGGTLKPIACQAFRWVSQRELNHFHFPEADSKLISELAASPAIWD
jgi:mutator protein MutT